MDNVLSLRQMGPHDECAGVESDDDDEFTCDICLQK
jgi:hypothetical protein